MNKIWTFSMGFVLLIIFSIGLNAQTKCIAEFVIHDDIIRICNNGLYGYADRNFKEIIPPQYEYGKAFDNGYCVVKKDGKWGVINKKNKVIIPFIYRDIINYGKGIFTIHTDTSINIAKIRTNKLNVYPEKLLNVIRKDGGFIISSVNGKSGVIDYDLNLIIPFEYEGIQDYTEGMTKISIFVDEELLIGYYDNKAREVIPRKYILGTNFSKSMAGVMNARKEVVPVGPDDDCCNIANHCYHVYYHDLYWEIINNKGERIIDGKFDTVLNPNEGMMPVRKDGKWGYVNNKGKLVVDCIYDKVSDFKEGLAFVEKDSKVKLINNKGKDLTEPIFDKIEVSYETYNFYGGYAVVKQNHFYGLIDKKGRVVADFQYEAAKRHSEGLIPVTKNGKAGYINTKGEVAIDLIYEFAAPFKEGFAYVRHNNEAFIINTKGNCAWNCD